MTVMLFITSAVLIRCANNKHNSFKQLPITGTNCVEVNSRQYTTQLAGISGYVYPVITKNVIEAITFKPYGVSIGCNPSCFFTDLGISELS